MKRTFQAKKLKQKRTYGFLARNSSKKGRKIMAGRRLKGRARINH